MAKVVKDVKVVAGEECAPQHRIGDLVIKSAYEAKAFCL